MPNVQPLATIGILSIGEMGLGIARLLNAFNFRAITNLRNRSDSTYQRAASASIIDVESDQELVAQSDYILSIVPPRDALATAKRMVAVIEGIDRSSPLYFLDLNAISPRLAREISGLFESTPIRFLDGGIIGPAPSYKDSSWSRPSLVVSGPADLQGAPVSPEELIEILNIKQISSAIGSASGLKMCFASTTKGLTAIAIQSFSTAQKLGVLPELQQHLAEYSSATGQLAEKALIGMPPKAYRWVREMEEIAETFHEEGGFDKDMFLGASEIFRTVAEETELGNEKTESRRRGKDTEDVARLMNEGLRRKRSKTH